MKNETGMDLTKDAGHNLGLSRASISSPRSSQVSKLVKFFDKSQVAAQGEDATLNQTKNLEDSTIISRLGR